MFFTDKKRKKNLVFSFLALFIISGAVFVFSDVRSAHATCPSTPRDCFFAAGGGIISLASSVAADKVKEKAVEGATNIVVTGFKWLLYGIFVMLGWMASLAITIFEFILKPEYVTMLFDGPGVYESWKFIRDFFNLFFILVLLYIAFTVVFQINKDFKKTLLSLVLAALFINFSFPVSRFLIDATNVPMYFFANSMMANNQGRGVFSETMQASSIKNILIPGSGVGIEEVDFDQQRLPRLLVAIVFMFLFSITLLVLAVMFVIRLVALVILVIFSSVGFAASIIPGMGQYSKMWWDNFWKYALFGPAAMLMLLIATRFFASLGGTEGPLISGLRKVAGSTVGASEEFFASMALFSIPIIMLWFAMGLAQKMSIAGATSVVGAGQKVAKWVGAAPFRAGWAGLKFADRKIEKKAAEKGMWTPRAFVEGVKRRSAEQSHSDEKIFHLQGAKIQDQLNGFISRFTNPIKSIKAGYGIDHTDNYSAEMAKQTDESAKHMSSISTNSDIVSEHLDKAIIKGDQTEILGLMKVLFKDNNENDAMEFLAKKRGFTKINSETVKHDFIKGILKEAGMSDENIAKQAMAMSDAAIGAGNVGYAGMGTYNSEKHRYELTDERTQAMIVGAKMKNMETQAQERMIHPDSQFERVLVTTIKKDEVIPDEYVDLQIRNGGKIAKKDIDIWGHGDLNGLAGQAIFETYTRKNLGQINRSRGDRKAAHAGAHKNIESLPKFKALYDDNDIVKEYVDAAVKDYNNPGSGEQPEGKKKESEFDELKNKLKEQRNKNRR